MYYLYTNFNIHPAMFTTFSEEEARIPLPDCLTIDQCGIKVGIDQVFFLNPFDETFEILIPRNTFLQMSNLSDYVNEETEKSLRGKFRCHDLLRFIPLIYKGIKGRHLGLSSNQYRELMGAALNLIIDEIFSFSENKQQIKRLGDIPIVFVLPFREIRSSPDLKCHLKFYESHHYLGYPMFSLMTKPFKEGLVESKCNKTGLEKFRVSREWYGRNMNFIPGLIPDYPLDKFFGFDETLRDADISAKDQKRIEREDDERFMWLSEKHKFFVKKLKDFFALGGKPVDFLIRPECPADLTALVPTPTPTSAPVPAPTPSLPSVPLALPSVPAPETEEERHNRLVGMLARRETITEPYDEDEICRKIYAKIPSERTEDEHTYTYNLCCSNPNPPKLLLKEPESAKKRMQNTIPQNIFYPNSSSGYATGDLAGAFFPSVNILGSRYRSTNAVSYGYLDHSTGKSVIFDGYL